MSEPQHDHRYVAAAVPRARRDDDGVRLDLKPGLPRTGFVDGGWWPRSRDLRAEAPGLLAALAAQLGRRIGPVLRIGFGPAQWEPVGRLRLDTPAGRVAFSGFPTFEPDLVWVTSHATALRPIALLVVPPETPHTRAVAALSRASSTDNAERPAALLERHEGDHGGSAYTLLDVMK